MVYMLIGAGVMSAICGLLAGTQIFRADDSPTYLINLAQLQCAQC